jgi:hypothetical protein
VSTTINAKCFCGDRSQLKLCAMPAHICFEFNVQVWSATVRCAVQTSVAKECICMISPVYDGKMDMMEDVFAHPAELPDGTANIIS